MSEVELKESMVHRKLQDKTFLLQGSFDSTFYSNATQCIVQMGGEVHDSLSPALSYLVVEGRGTKNTKEQAQKLNREGARINIINTAALLELLKPSREEAIAILTDTRQDHLWSILNALLKAPDLNLQNADLRNVNFGEKRLQADLRGADLTGGTFRNYINQISDANFNQSTFWQTRIGMVKNCNFEECEFYEFSGCSFYNCNCTNAQFRNLAGRLVFYQSNCRGADFSAGFMPNSSLRWCDFTGANFQNANLIGADLCHSKFTGADLTGVRLDGAIMIGVDLTDARLNNAILVGADLSDATVMNADFSDTRLEGANLTTVAPHTALHLLIPESTPPVERGRILTELDKTSTQVEQLTIQVLATVANSTVKLEAVSRRNGTECLANLVTGNTTATLAKTQSLSEAMQLFGRYYPCADVDISSAANSLGESFWYFQACQAWADVFALPCKTPDELERTANQKKSEFHAEAIGYLKAGPEGIARWNRIGRQTLTPMFFCGTTMRTAPIGDLTKMDLAKCNLSNVDISHLNLSGAKLQESQWQRANGCGSILTKSNFMSASCSDSKFINATIKNCDFKLARLSGINLEGANLQKSKFPGAIIESCNFSRADLRNCDFSEAILRDDIFSKAQFNESTMFPEEFDLPDDLIWSGKGDSPLVLKTLAKAAAAGPVDFPAFIKRLESSVDADRLKNALKMLKTERFQLFADVEKDCVVGIVKSQTDADLLYSCILTATGSFACCSQNLNPCGGLKGALCKHLLVLLIGLSRCDALDPTLANMWVCASQMQKPRHDKDILSNTLLRYKGAEAGEIDWRPTETMPEDYYAI